MSPDHVSHTSLSPVPCKKPRAASSQDDESDDESDDEPIPNDWTDADDDTATVAKNPPQQIDKLDKENLVPFLFLIYLVLPIMALVLSEA